MVQYKGSSKQVLVSDLVAFDGIWRLAVCLALDWSISIKSSRPLFAPPLSFWNSAVDSNHKNFDTTCSLSARLPQSNEEVKPVRLVNLSRNSKFFWPPEVSREASLSV